MARDTLSRSMHDLGLASCSAAPWPTPWPWTPQPPRRPTTSTGACANAGC